MNFCQLSRRTIQRELRDVYFYVKCALIVNFECILSNFDKEVVRVICKLYFVIYFLHPLQFLIFSLLLPLDFINSFKSYSISDYKRIQLLKSVKD